ncbi:uroporphyrinogen-III synthase [Hirschia litorea]|uniref:Uroporphyrinogen-III synthase n=1 Tax=Hirschia litorea TaxID=1199156 RepID=A0ABW2IMW1_9PROT
MTPKDTPWRTVLVTRAEPGATHTMTRLTKMGLLAEKLPAIKLIPSSVVFSEQNFEGALIFTSQNGVQFAPRAPFRKAKSVFCVGDATAQAAHQAGFKNILSARGDAEALIQFVKDHWKIEDGPLLHMGNADPRGNIVATLTELGYEARFMPIYKASMPINFEEKLRDRLLMDLKLDVILVHSPMAAAFIDHALQDWNKLSTVTLPQCVAISPEAGKPLQDIFNGQVRFAAKPNENSLLEQLISP